MLSCELQTSRFCTGVDRYGSSVCRDCASQSQEDAAFNLGTRAQGIVSVLMIRRFKNPFCTWHILRKSLIDERIENGQVVSLDFLEVEDSAMPATGVQVTFRGMQSSAQIRAEVEERIKKLERVCDRITRCRVTIQKPHQHHLKGNPYQVTVDITVPDHEVVVSKGTDKDRIYNNLYAALRDAFDASQRRLEQYVKQSRLGTRRSPPLLVQGFTPPTLSA